MNAALIEVSQLWGDSLLRVERFSPWRRVTIGRGGDFVGPVRYDLVQGGAVHAPGSRIPISAETDVRVDVAGQTFRVRAVPHERRVPFDPFQHVDGLYVIVCLALVGLLVLEAIVLVVVWLLIQLFKLLLMVVGMALGTSLLPSAPVAPPQPTRVIEVSLVAPAPAPQPFFVKATPRPTMTPIPMGDILDKRRIVKPREIENEILMAMDSGVFATLSSIESDDVSYGGLIASLEEEGVEGGVEGGVSGGVVGGVVGGELTALGGLRGTEVAGAYEGGGGLGLSGSGGGGTSLDIGGLGTRGSGRGTGYGRIGVSNGEVSLGEVEAEEGLSAEIIRAVIRRHLGAIRYCYERELDDGDSLAGKIVVGFTIDGNGAVENATVRSSTMPGGEDVEACLVRRISLMRFPAPRDGARVTVSYPFVFERS